MREPSSLDGSSRDAASFFTAVANFEAKTDSLVVSARKRDSTSVRISGSPLHISSKRAFWSEGGKSTTARKTRSTWSHLSARVMWSDRNSLYDNTLSRKIYYLSCGANWALDSGNRSRSAGPGL